MKRQQALDPAVIQSRLGGTAVCGLHVFDTIGSTNAWLLERCTEFSSPQLCVAETQTKGRGRRGKSWQSPTAGVTFSIFRRFRLPAAKLSGLSLVTGCAVASALETFGVGNVKLKWPNDILCNGKKLCGLLIEMGATGDFTDTVTGIGMNYHGVGDSGKIDQPFADLASVLGKRIPDRSALIGDVTAAVLEAYSQYEAQGMSGFRELWEAFDAYRGKSVLMIQSNGEQIAGIARGLADSGALLIETDSGVREFYAGEVSLRLQS